MKVFLAIEIGNKTAFEQEQGAFALAERFYKSIAPQYGWAGSLEDLDNDSKAILTESFSTQPSWTSQGAIQTEPPRTLAAGQIVAELDTKDAPKAAENFRCLCTGEKGNGKSSGKPLHFKGNKFHRIVKGFVCQGGDVVRGDGSSGDSIYGGKFNDEKGALKKKHTGPGVLSMANSGKNSNTSQFFFTLAAVPQCDGKHVVFGRVVEGLDILHRINEEAASADGTPMVDVTIADCGIV